MGHEFVYPKIHGFDDFHGHEKIKLVTENVMVPTRISHDFDSYK